MRDARGTPGSGPAGTAGGVAIEFASESRAVHGVDDRGLVDSEDRRRARADAFSDLAARHLDAAYRLACAVLADPVEAEDATHDAAVLAWRSFERLREPERFEQWFCRIVLNVCRDRLRRRRRQPVRELPGDDEAEALAVADPSGRLDAGDALARAFDRLSPDHQIAIVLRYYRDLSVDEIAVRLDVPCGTVKSRLHHALRRLRGDLERQGWREEGSRER